MQSSNKKAAHKSRWKTITVVGNDETINFQLDEKGRLAPGFKKQKYRKILKYIKMLESNPEKPENAELKPQHDENKKIQQSIELSNVYDSNKNDLDIFEEFESLEYLDFITK